MDDGIPATDQWFVTPDDARQFIKEYRQKYRDLQGYYMNHRQERIDPDDIQLRIIGEYRQGLLWMKFPTYR